MTYPQTQASLAVTGGQDYWRLFTTLLSPGDLYESDVSSHAFVLGPQSDISNVKLTYFDSQMSNRVQSAIVSPDKGLIGRFDAHNDAQRYPTGNVPGRILITVEDVFDPNMPLGIPLGDSTYNPANDLAIVNMPLIDLFQYFSPPGAVSVPRVDKTYYYQQYQDTPDPAGRYYIMIPFFGRRYAFIHANNQDPASVRNLVIHGINFTPTTNPTQLYLTKQLFTAAFNAGTILNDIELGSADGDFDYLAVVITGGPVGAESIPLSVTVSDDAL